MGRSNTLIGCVYQRAHSVQIRTLRLSKLFMFAVLQQNDVSLTEEKKQIKGGEGI